jgi:hypothetical protein
MPLHRKARFRQSVKVGLAAIAKREKDSGAQATHSKAQRCIQCTGIEPLKRGDIDPHLGGGLQHHTESEIARIRLRPKRSSGL